METNKKIMIALGAGLAIGGILGILFAPDKGSETRRKIKDSGTRLTDNLKETANSFRKKAENMKKDITERFDGMEETINEYI